MCTTANQKEKREKKNECFFSAILCGAWKTSKIVRNSVICHVHLSQSCLCDFRSSMNLHRAQPDEKERQINNCVAQCLRFMYDLSLYGLVLQRRMIFIWLSTSATGVINGLLQIFTFCQFVSVSHCQCQSKDYGQTTFHDDDTRRTDANVLA